MAVTYTLSENVSLLPYNTFHLAAEARYFTEVHSEEMLGELIRDGHFSRMPHLVLGGGSNMLFAGNFNGLVVRNLIRGIEVTEETNACVYVKAAGGEIWHHLVMFCVGHTYGGIENLSLIPGTAGAAPIQNIGAYGVELTDVFESLEAIDLITGEKKIFDKTSCEFGYRSSIFKQGAKGKYFITSVTLRLNKSPQVKITYGAISETLEKMGITEPGIADVSEAVIRIRKSKLPDPNEIGNAGSFFKNPEIPQAQYDQLITQFENMPGYKTTDDMIKVPAGWLIEQCGWKGKRVGNTGAHKDQALVLVNYGGATGNEIYALALEIQESVKEKFNIHIEPEVNLIKS